MSKKMKTALVGCGKVGHFHAKAFVNLEESEFTAVCDRNLARAEEFAQQYGVKAYDDIEKMIAAEKIDVVSICTPHPVHAAMAVPAAKMGCHVLIEKPLASNLADCDAILSAAKEGKAKVGTVCQRRFYEPCMRIKKAIDDGKLGNPILGSVTMLGWRDKAYYESDPWRGTWTGEGGGVLVNQAPHQLDLLLWYMGEIDEVYGVWKNLNHPYIEVDDTAVAIIKFKNGGIGQVLVSNSQNPALYGKVHVHGDNGASVGVQTDGGAMFIAGVSSITEPPYNDIWTVTGEADKREEWQQADSDLFNSVDSMYHYHQLQIQDFLNSIIENKAPLIDGDAGRRTVELIEAIYRSTKENCVIKFPLRSQ
ncbi:Gfo/Idh/MocA family protein [Zophobihabitans entericus]|uniref:Gfo/Idh/MocA family oxidoreductase n=1 Tax=Zophobihabitans entericus TaxID=1635327 RepID=A0A6G9I9M3_9GAMM|nr:Gfo/Idh/MocA family oxidoreductase [Zophobihabitans entericus]QIQ20537.1 Gfo/Idh/MocA family oxidoreductase [Zophobihabitans entericus]